MTRFSLAPNQAISNTDTILFNRSRDMTTTITTDLGALLRLNDDYVQSVRRSDVGRFAELLADDFMCSMPDGSLIDRAQFLEQIARPYVYGGLEAKDVQVRLLDNFAIIHARTTFTHPDGSAGAGRYTDIWAKRDGRWVTVAAHVTRR